MQPTAPAITQNKAGDIFIDFEAADVSDDKKLIPLKPFGMQLSADGMRPMLLLKDASGELTLPVPLNPLEAGVTLTQSNKSITPTTPHRVTELLLEGLNLKVETCVFTEIKGLRQYVRLQIQSSIPANGEMDLANSSLKYLRVRAEEAMSFCLHFNVPMFATRNYIARSRTLSIELEGVTKGVQANPELMDKQHKFMM